MRIRATTRAVDDVSFDLKPARVTALVGQSGSGKTTIARLVTGVERPTSGSITFANSDAGKLRGRKLRSYRRHTLDVSIRAEILALLDQLVKDRGIAMLYITHDLLSARLLADEVLVLNEGKVVESGPTLTVIQHAQDPYTQLLLDAIPTPGQTVLTDARSLPRDSLASPNSSVVRGS